ACVGASKRPSIRRVVVFPQPEGPSRLKNSPRSMSSVRSSTAVTSANRLVTRSSRTSTSLTQARLQRRASIITPTGLSGASAGELPAERRERVDVAVDVVLRVLDGERPLLLVAGRPEPAAV